MATQEKPKGADPKNSVEVKPKSNKRTVEELLEYHNDKVKSSQEVVMDDAERVCFDYVVNTGGVILMIPDFNAVDKNPQSEMVFEIPAGEVINLRNFFDTKAINRNRRGLLTAFKLKSTLDERLPTLLCIENKDIEFPFPLTKKSFVDRLKDKNIKHQDLGINQFDIALEKEVKKEKKQHEKASEQVGQSTEGKKTKAEVEASI